MSREKEPNIASALVDLRAAYGESQHKFSLRLGAASTSIALWELGQRYPSPRFLKELWHLAAEQNRADLAKVFSKAFALNVGYALTGEGGFHMRRLISEIRSDAGKLLFEELSPESRTRVENIVRAASKLRDALREMDIEPPYRSFTRVKGKR